MTEKRLYALNESDVVKLTKLAEGFEAVATRLGHLDDARLNRGFIASLVPVDRDAAVERMARAAFKARCETESFTWAKAGLFRKAYLDDARTALDGLLGGGDDAQRACG